MSQENVEIVQRGFEAWRRGDVEAMMEDIDRDVITHRAPPQPDAGSWRGPDGLLEAIANWFGGFDDVAVTTKDLIDANDTQVILQMHQRGVGAESRAPVEANFWMVYTLRERLFSHLQSLSLAHHDRTPRGDTVYRLEADAKCVEQLLLRGLFPMAFSALTLAVMFSVLASFDGTLALVAMSIAPLLYLAMRLQTQRMSSGNERMRELESRMVERLYESFSTIRLVKGFAREPHELRRFSGAASDAMDARLRLTARASSHPSALTLPGRRP